MPGGDFSFLLHYLQTCCTHQPPLRTPTALRSLTPPHPTVPNSIMRDPPQAASHLQPSSKDHPRETTPTSPSSLPVFLAHPSQTTANNLAPTAFPKQPPSPDRPTATSNKTTQPRPMPRRRKTRTAQMPCGLRCRSHSPRSRSRR